jgi:predicted RNase H-like nuclease (RuvC/YqgF family)
MNQPLTTLLHENAALKNRYYELFDQCKKLQNELDDVKENYGVKTDTHQKTLLYLQNTNVELQKTIIEKNKRILQLSDHFYK